MSLWCAIWLINLGVEDNQFGNEALQLIWPVDEISGIHLVFIVTCCLTSQIINKFSKI